MDQAFTAGVIAMGKRAFAAGLAITAADTMDLTDLERALWRHGWRLAMGGQK